MTVARFSGPPCLVVLLTRCASSDPVLHTLDVRPGPANAAQTSIIVVRDVSLPRYLQRLEIVRGSGPGQLSAPDGDWWAEPLATMTRRVMVADLAQRLPAADVLADGMPITRPTDTAIVVAIERFEEDAAGRVRLEGHFVVSTKGQAERLRRLTIIVPVATKTPGDQVSAMSDALGQGVNEIVRSLDR